MSALSRPEFHSEEAAFAHLEKHRLGRRAGLPALRRRGPHYEGQGQPGEAHSRRPVALRRLQEPVHGQGRHGVRACPPSAAQGASGRLSDDVAARRAFAPTSCTASWRSPTRRAWFLAHRIREAMRSGDLAPFGSGGGAVEVDETFIGRVQGVARKRRLSPQDEGSGAGRPRQRHARATFIRQVRAPTPSSRSCSPTSPRSPAHDRREPASIAASAASSPSTAPRTTARASMSISNDRTIHTNTIEGYFSHLQARHEGHLSALRRAAPSPLSGRVRVPLSISAPPMASMTASGRTKP